jgi:hypothetical protein
VRPSRRGKSAQNTVRRTARGPQFHRGFTVDSPCADRVFTVKTLYFTVF